MYMCIVHVYSHVLCFLTCTCMYTQTLHSLKSPLALPETATSVVTKKKKRTCGVDLSGLCGLSPINFSSDNTPREKQPSTKTIRKNTVHVPTAKEEKSSTKLARGTATKRVARRGNTKNEKTNSFRTKSPTKPERSVSRPSPAIKRRSKKRKRESATTPGSIVRRSIDSSSLPRVSNDMCTGDSGSLEDHFNQLQIVRTLYMYVSVQHE